MNVVPWPRVGVDVDPAAQRLDVAAHDVHADAAAGDVGDLLGGREARLEDQLMDVVGRRAARPRRSGRAAIAFARIASVSGRRRRRRSR